MKDLNSEKISLLAREEAVIKTLIAATNDLVNVQFTNRSKEIFKEKTSPHELSKKIEEFRNKITNSDLPDIDKKILSGLNNKDLYAFARKMFLQSLKAEIPN